MDETKLLVLADRFKKLRDRVDGLSVKQEEIQLKEGQQGPKGEQGDRGFDGAPGKEGDDGADGTDGQDGKDGVSVVNAEITFDGSLVIYLSDGREIDCGEVVKETGDTVIQTLKQGASVSGGGGITSITSTDGSVVITTVGGVVDLSVKPAGATTQIQYNNAGVFGGSANFFYTSGTNTVSFGNITGSALAMTIQPLAPTSGSAGALTVQARAGVATNGAGGALNLTAGAGVGTGAGGALNLTAGNAVNGVAGAMTFNAGDSTNSTGGALTFNAGDSASGGVGGSLVFQGGNGVPGGGGMTFTSGFGGSMSFTAGETTGGPYNAGGLTFAAGSYTGSSFTQNGGSLTFTSGSSASGPAGEFACLTGVGTTSSGDVRLETGFVSGGGSGDINFITGVSGLSAPAVAGNLVYTGGTSGFDDDDVSGTGGGLTFTGGYGYGSAGVGGSFTFTAGGGNATQGSINLATVSGTSIQLADNGARQLGFFGATPVVKPAPTASGTGAVLSSVVTALNNLGLINSTALTNASAVFTSSATGLVPASGGGTTTFLRADGTFATPSGSGGGATPTSGTSTIDFGTGNGSNEASIAVTGQTSISSTSVVTLTVKNDATSTSHTANDHSYFLELASLNSNTPTAGTGFTIKARSIHKLTGTWTISWSWV